MKVLEINCETGEQITRNMTKEELAQYEKNQEAAQKLNAE